MAVVSLQLEEADVGKIQEELDEDEEPPAAGPTAVFPTTYLQPAPFDVSSGALKYVAL